MKIVVQRVLNAEVKVDSVVMGSIDHGLLILFGVETGDTQEDVKVAAQKISKLRIFDDEEGVMNLSIKDIEGSILSISQFTLAASTRKGNRPSYINAMNPKEANQFYQMFNQYLENDGIKVEKGVFQAHMNVTLNNDGPVTIVISLKDGKVL